MDAFTEATCSSLKSFVARLYLYSATGMTLHCAPVPTIPACGCVIKCVHVCILKATERPVKPAFKGDAKTGACR